METTGGYFTAISMVCFWVVFSSGKQDILHGSFFVTIFLGKVVVVIFTLLGYHIGSFVLGGSCILFL